MPPDSQESAALQVFRIPHLLSAVIQFIGCQPSEEGFTHYITLLNCMLVNSSWQSEAIKAFWAKASTGPGHLPVPSLTRLLKADSERRQAYANCICKLEIYLSGRGKDSNDSDDEDSEDEASFPFPGIDLLSFPRLISLSIFAPHIPSPKVSYWMPLRQFIHANLRQLRFDVCNANDYLISDPFLRHVEQEATQLSDIEVGVQIPQFAAFDEEGKLPPKRMIAFLERVRAKLERFRWCIHSAMSPAAFELLSSCLRLESLNSLQIEDSWVVDRDFATSSSGFPNLKEVKDCSISGRALRTLLPSFNKVELLGLYETEDPATLWTVIVGARFVHLSSLKLILSFDTILYADDILSVARHHPQLQTFELWPNGLGPNYYYPLMAKGFNDATISELAQSLPKLRNLCLSCYDEMHGLLGQESLIALSYHCALLKECHLYANINWEKFLLSEEFSDVMWPRLENLHLKFHDSEGVTVDAPLEFEDMMDLGRLLLERLPMMRQLPARLDDSGQARNIAYALLRIVSAERRAAETKGADG